MRRYVILGARGFVGNAIYLTLQAQGLSPVAVSRLHQADSMYADLQDETSVRAILQPGDIVINAAGYAAATDTTPEGLARFQAANVEGVRNLAQAAAAARVAHLVHISSVAAMGRWRRHGVTETMQNPVTSPYSASKRAGEEILAEYRGELPITILRPTSVFGEGRSLTRILCKASSYRFVPLPAGGRAKIPFTYIGNLSHAVTLCADNPACFDRNFIVGDETSYPLRDIIGALARALGKAPTIVPVPVVTAQLGTKALVGLAKARGAVPLLDEGRLETLTQSVSFSIAAFQEATGYQPPYTLAMAAERIAAWYRLEQRDREE